jgi:hypothetical protein
VGPNRCPRSLTPNPANVSGQSTSRDLLEHLLDGVNSCLLIYRDAVTDQRPLPTTRKTIWTRAYLAHSSTNGVTYTIDVSDKNAGKLRNALNPYLSVASRVGRSGAGGRIASRNTAAAPSRSNGEQNQAIRE